MRKYIIYLLKVSFLRLPVPEFQQHHLVHLGSVHMVGMYKCRINVYFLHSLCIYVFYVFHVYALYCMLLRYL